MFHHTRKYLTLLSKYYPRMTHNRELREKASPDFGNDIVTLRLLHVTQLPLESASDDDKYLLRTTGTLPDKTSMETGMTKQLSASDPVSGETITPSHLRYAVGLQNISYISKCFKKYKEFETMSPDLLEARVASLKYNGIPRERIKMALWLLLRPYEELEIQIKEVAAILKLDYYCAVPFAYIPPTKIHQIRKRWEEDKLWLLKCPEGKFSNRIEYLASRLKLTNEDVAYMLGKTVQVSKMPLEKIKSVLHALEEGGIKSEDIYTDPYIFTFGASTLLTRIKLAKDHNLENIKPWMFRDSEFAEFLTRTKCESDLLSGHPNVLSFIQQELKCTSVDTYRIASKIPNIHTLKARKIRETIQFLLTKGYTNKNVVEYPWILTYSLETIKLRHKQLEGKGATPMKIYQLCLSSREFELLLVRIGSFNREATKKTLTTSSKELVS